MTDTIEKSKTLIRVSADPLGMDVKPIPPLMPGIERANIAYYEDELNPFLEFKPSPRQILMTNTAKVLGTPLKYFVVLWAEANRACLVLVVPHGHLARWERQQNRRDQELAEIKKAINDLAATIANNQQEQRQREIELIRRIEISHQQAQQAASRQLARRRLPLDPVVPATGVEMPPYTLHALRNYYWHVISWRDEFSLQQNQAWGAAAQRFAGSAIKAVRHGLKATLSPVEIDWMCHYLDFCITDPSMWWLKVNPEDED